MADPLFSVVMPLYNKADFVRSAIDSVLAQTFSEFELLVVDDASTDGSADRVRDVSDGRIRLLHRSEPGPGGYAARNVAIDHARSPWIAFLDADDEWLPDHLAVAFRLIQDFPDASVLSLGRRSWNGQEYREYAYTNRVCMESVDVLRILARTDLFHTNAVLARKTALEHAGLFPAGKAKRGGDYDLWVRLLLDRNRVAVSPDITSVYRKERSGVIADPTALESIHPVTRTVRERLSASPTSFTRRETRLLKSVSNRRQFNWAWERKRLGVHARGERCALYKDAFSLRDWAKYLRLCLPHRNKS